MMAGPTSDLQGQGRAKPYCTPYSGDVEYFGACEVVAEELRAIRQRRGERELPHDPELKTADLSGLALSGGGIRSASFSLGVMQALAHNGWLARFDYLSTVSGGGYIGSGLTWAMNTSPETFGLTDTTFPFASFPMSGESRHTEQRTPLQSVLQGRTRDSRWSGRLLHFLRQNADYLVPGKGHNLCALVWIALRGAGMGLLVYGALITLIFLLAFQLGLLREVCLFPWLPGALRQNWFVLAAVIGWSFWALSIPGYALATYWYHRPSLRGGPGRGKAYHLRRLYEAGAGRILPWLLAVLLIGMVPWIHGLLKEQGASAAHTTGARELRLAGTLSENGSLSLEGAIQGPASPARSVDQAPLPGTGDRACVDSPPAPPGSFRANLVREFDALLAGLGTVLVGLFSGIAAFCKTMRPGSGKVPLNLLVLAGVSGLLAGIVLVAYTGACAVIATTGYGATTWGLIVAGLAVTLMVAVFANLNHISIHRYYRDRLMETFMPEIREVVAGNYDQAGESAGANITALHDMVHGLYHIVNTNVVLVHSRKPKSRGRGGDNFILSPQYCGSNATGWQATADFMQGGMTLATAMAVSGAAINPSAGCGGQGVTRSPALSILMGLLNFRLGYWVPNPKNWNKKWHRGLRNPNFLLPGLWEVAFRNELNEDGSFLQLSDGGHFENLGLYELVRRRLRLIVICDAGADPKYSFSDLANAVHKVRTDFGALIMLENEQLDLLIPKTERETGGIPCAGQGHLVATIKYADNSTGTLIYLTTTFFQGLSADLYGYRKAHPTFPDESTGDQFFDEQQFEAYRELGFQTAWKMMDQVTRDADLAGRVWPERLPA